MRLDPNRERLGSILSVCIKESLQSHNPHACFIVFVISKGTEEESRGVYHIIIYEKNGIVAVELKSTLGWPSLQARRNYLKCVLVHKCLHGIAPSYLLSESLGTRTFFMAITPEFVIYCPLPSQKLPNTKVASE